MRRSEFRRRASPTKCHGPRRWAVPTLRAVHNRSMGSLGAVSPERSNLQAKCLSTSGKSAAKLSLFGQAAAGRFEVGAFPVAGLGGKRGVLAPGFAADAVMLVIGEEPREIAQLGIRAGGDRATAVAIGAKGRAEGQCRVAQIDESRPW